MKKILNTCFANKESFHEWVLACCDTLVRNEDRIYNMTKDYTRYIDITFPIRVDNEISTMLINIEKVVQNEEQKIVVIQSIDKDKENEKDEN